MFIKFHVLIFECRIISLFLTENVIILRISRLDGLLILTLTKMSPEDMVYTISRVLSSFLFNPELHARE